MGATCQFHVQLTIHVQAIIQGGVFDRFPDAQIIVGHLGENLVLLPCWGIDVGSRCISGALINMRRIGGK
jgi:hypothetical protein